jgi:hypothetical protein
LLDECFSRGKFWRWVISGAWQGFFILYLTIFTLEGGHAVYDDKGYPSCLGISGTLVYAQVVVVANSKLAFSTHAHTL